MDREFIVICAYASANQSHKETFLKELTEYCLTLDIPYLVIGDFSEIDSSDDKLGGAIRTLEHFKTINNFKNTSNAMDLPFLGIGSPDERKKGDKIT